MLVGILIMLMIIVAGFGFFLLSQATQGIGILALACVLGILARILQAENHHYELKKLLEEEE